MYRVFAKFAGLGVSKLMLAKKLSPHDHHLIFASPRGGSTWLMEIIQTITNEPVIWEPLHLKRKNSPFVDLKFGWRQFIPENEKWTDAKVTFTKLFQGNVLTGNLLAHASLQQILSAKGLLFKFCRGNALLPWLVKNFEFKYRPIYLLRHPMAVVCSQIRHGAWNDSHFKPRIQRPVHLDEVYQQHSDYLQSLSSKEEVLVAQWCLSNYPTLGYRNNNREWITIHYEDLVIEPERTIARILNIWDIDYDLSQINFQVNSSTTKSDSSEIFENRIKQWKSYFSNDQIARMGRVLDHFCIEVYRSDKFLPVV